MANLSQIKRERMLEFLEHLRLENPDEESLIAINEIENALTEKKYGLVWEEHEEQVDVMMKTHVPVFREVKDREIKGNPNDDSYNFLLEGDNLHSLKLLEKTHKGKIDVIYIDPPYNIGGKSFKYNDAYVKKDDDFKHSFWLSFMSERLEIAKDLLKEDGYIFVSINDMENAQLKMLMDEIFGENCFVAQLVWESTTQPTNTGAARFNIQKKTEPIYVYSRKQEKKRQFILEKKDSDFSYPHMGKFGKCRFEIIEKSDAGAYERKSMKYEILGQKPREGKRWQIGLETARELEAKGKLEIVDGIVKKAVYPEDEIDKIQYVPFWSLLKAKDVDTAQTGKEELKDVLGYASGFDTVKSLRLMKELFSHFNSNILVLDFFAGSGTTGQALLEMNKQDGGNRRYILCTDNEENICEELTYNRIKNVISGVREDNSVYSDGINSNLKYYKTDFIVKENVNDEFYSVGEELLKHIKEMVQLEHGISLDDDNYILILTDDEADELEKNSQRLEKCKGIYISSGVFLTETQEKLFNDIPIETIPDYYFETELREVGEL